MAIKQLSVFVENKKGTIHDVTKSIAEAGVDIRALSVADTQDFGILRLIVSDIEKAKDALSEGNCVGSVTKGIAVSVSDVPGGLCTTLFGKASRGRCERGAKMLCEWTSEGELNKVGKTERHSVNKCGAC